jgi:hypothetical protein
MRQVLHMMYAAFMVLIGSAGKPVSYSGPLPSFNDFNRQMWAGKVDLADNELKVLYGRVHWQQFLHNILQPRFEEALTIIRTRHAGQDGLPRLLHIAQ